VLPPGLYEAVLRPVGAVTDGADLITGEWVMRCEARTLDDIRALGCNDLEDERRFAASAKVSEINLAFYRTYLQPAVKAMTAPAVAEAMRQMHPLRLQYELFGPNNPFMSWVQAVAAQARESRKSVSFENPFLAMQEKMSQQIVDALDAWRQTVERASEGAFHAIYGSPVLQTALGIDRNSDRQPRKSAKNQLHEAFVEAQIAALKAEIDKGGLPEGLARALLFVGKAREGADERGFEAIRRLRRAHPSARQLTFLQFKELLRKQFFMLLIDEEAAVAAIPKLLPKELDGRRAAFNALREILQASGAVTGAAAERLDRVERIFDLGGAPVSLAASRASRKPKAS
jgi:hypothetical protein